MQHYLLGTFRELRHPQPTTHWAWTLLDLRYTCTHVLSCGEWSDRCSGTCRCDITDIVLAAMTGSAVKLALVPTHSGLTVLC